MDITEPQREPIAFDDEPAFRPLRRDRRNVLACFIACALVASAAVLVTRSLTTARPVEAPTTIRPSTTTVPFSGPGDAGGQFNELFDERLRELFGGQDSGTPDGRGNGSSGWGDHAPGSTVPDDSSAGPIPDGWTSSELSVGGRSFMLRHPNEWTVDEREDNVTVGSADGVIGVGVGVAANSGRDLPDWMQEWVTRAKSTMPDSQILEEGSVTVGGRAGYRLRTAGAYQGERLEGDFWLVADGDVVWLITCGAPYGDGESRSTCDRVAESLRPLTEA